MVKLVRQRCIYCGLPCARVYEEGRVLVLKTCVGHADLPALDPWFGVPDDMEEK